MEGIVTIRELEVDGHNVMMALVDIDSLKASEMNEILPLLTPSEKERFDEIRIDKRKWEWLAVADLPEAADRIPKRELKNSLNA